MTKPLAAALLAVWLIVPATHAATAAGPEAAVETLENGLRVVVVPDPLAPVVTTVMNYLAGSNEAPEGFPGMAHALEHMMFRGSPGLSAAQLATLMADMGGQFNADTQQTITQYFCSVPADDLDVVLHLEAVRMRGVLATDELWSAERGAIEQEVAQDLSEPLYVLSSKLLEKLYAGTPYAHDALGTRPSFEKTTGAMLRKFHQDWYAPNNAVLVIAGDVVPAHALAVVREALGGIPRRPVPPRPAVHLKPLARASLRMETDLPYGLAVIAYRLPGYGSPDWAAGEILADILNSQRGNLYELVVQGKALSTQFESNPLPSAGMGAAFAAFPHGADGEDLVRSIEAVIAGYRKSGVPADLVEAAKRKELADAQFGKNSVTGLGFEWSHALAVQGLASPEEKLEAIRRVVPEDVDRVARKYLDATAAVTAVLLPKASGTQVAGKAARGRESFTPSRAEAVPLPAWAQKALEPPTVPSSRLAPTVATLANGLRLIVQPVTVSPTVSLYGRVKSQPDLQAPAGKEGVDGVLDDLFSYGTTTRDRLALRSALDAIAADASAGAEFSLQVLDEFFEKGVALLADNLLHPALPPEAFAIVRAQHAGELAGRLQSPGYRSHRAVRQALYPVGDPALRQATPQTVSGLTLDDVKKYYEQVFRPDMTTIVVVGKVDPAEARAVVEKHFGAWHAEGPRPQTDLPPVPSNKPSTVAVPDASRVQDEVTLAQTLGITRADPAYYPLQLGNHVLSGAFYATRLYRDLRERAGLVYTVESFLQAGKTRSVFGVFYACDPGNVAKARAMAERDLREMQDRPVSAAELRQARTLLVRQIPLSEADTDSIAQGLLHRSVEELPLDEPVRAARRYLEISAADVQEAFRKWVRPNDLVQVSLGPEPH